MKAARERERNSVRLCCHQPATHTTSSAWLGTERSRSSSNSRLANRVFRIHRALLPPSLSFIFILFVSFFFFRLAFASWLDYGEEEKSQLWYRRLDFAQRYGCKIKEAELDDGGKFSSVKRNTRRPFSRSSKQKEGGKSLLNQCDYIGIELSGPRFRAGYIRRRAKWWNIPLEKNVDHLYSRGRTREIKKSIHYCRTGLNG